MPRAAAAYVLAGCAAWCACAGGGCAAKPTVTPAPPAPRSRWEGLTQVTCRNVSEVVLTMRLLKNRHHPELGDLAAITSGKGASLEVTTEMPSEAGLLVTSWNQDPALVPLTVPVAPFMMNRIEVDVIDGAILVRGVSVSPMPGR